MAPYHILIVIISSVIPENLVLLTKSEQSGPKSAHIRPTISNDRTTLSTLGGSDRIKKKKLQANHWALKKQTFP